jgi:hypothetical protein
MNNEIIESRQIATDLYSLGLKLGRLAKKSTKNYKSWLKRHGLLDAFNKIDSFHDGFLDGWQGW